MAAVHVNQENWRSNRHNVADGRSEKVNVEKYIFEVKKRTLTPKILRNVAFHHKWPWIFFRSFGRLGRFDLQMPLTLAWWEFTDPFIVIRNSKNAWGYYSFTVFFLAFCHLFFHLFHFSVTNFKKSSIILSLFHFFQGPLSLQPCNFYMFFTFSVSSFKSHYFFYHFSTFFKALDSWQPWYLFFDSLIRKYNISKLITV